MNTRSLVFYLVPVRYCETAICLVILDFFRLEALRRERYAFRDKRSNLIPGTYQVCSILPGSTRTTSIRMYCRYLEVLLSYTQALRFVRGRDFCKSWPSAHGD